MLIFNENLMRFFSQFSQLKEKNSIKKIKLNLIFNYYKENSKNRVKFSFFFLQKVSLRINIHLLKYHF